MTTIAADLEGMAADSYVADGTRAEKIRRVTIKAKDRGVEGPAIVGYAGDLYYAEMLTKWVADGFRGAPPCWEEHWRQTSDDTASDTELLVLHRTGLWRLDLRGFLVKIPHHYAAIGSGGYTANGALYHGHSPSEAVEAAIAHDCYTKGPITYLPLRRQRAAKGIA